MQRTLRQHLLEPLLAQNPITVQALGICSALAVTVKLKPSIVLAISVLVVMAVSNVVISLMRKMVPPRIRIIVQLVVIATMVILVDQVLKAFAYDVSKQLSVFVGLIITNCIVLGRAEAFAMQNGPKLSIIDGIGNAFGYTMILVATAFLRELFGNGSVYGYVVLPKVTDGGWYHPNGLLISSAGAFFIIGLFIWLLRCWKTDQIEEEG